jgi:hypothetical protein
MGFPTRPLRGYRVRDECALPGRDRAPALDGTRRTLPDGTLIHAHDWHQLADDVLGAVGGGRASPGVLVVVRDFSELAWARRRAMMLAMLDWP